MIDKINKVILQDVNIQFFFEIIRMYIKTEYRQVSI